MQSFVRLRAVSKPELRDAALRALPRVDHLAALLANEYPRVARHEILDAARHALESARREILAGTSDIDLAALPDRVRHHASALIQQNAQSSPRRVLNGTGIVVHTGLGRSLLSRAATEAIARVAASHCALEVDIVSGERGQRDAAIAALLREITGCEDATVVNNCAGATLIALNTLADGKTVICSRGELVEIGGGFRMPDVMTQSGAVLCEVGTTNKTRLGDYAAAISENTGALLKVHTSNYRVVGFTSEVALSELAPLGRERGVPVIEDLGSGVLANLEKVGLAGEPRVQESVASGADVICFSGDKLLGGPQCGVLVGRREAIERIRKNPMMRALRVDKFTLAALEATLRHYRDEAEAWREIPTLRALCEPAPQVKKRAQKLVRLLENVPARLEVRASHAQAGAGALPTQTIPSFAVVITPRGASLKEFAQRLRIGEPSIWGRINGGAFWLDCRTLQEDEVKECAILIGESLNNRSA